MRIETENGYYMHDPNEDSDMDTYRPIDFSRVIFHLRKYGTLPADLADVEDWDELGREVDSSMDPTEKESDNVN